MSTTIHLSLKVDTSKDAPLLALQVARALSHYASLLVAEAIGGEVVSGRDKLEFGTTRMRVRVEVDDYTAKE